MKIINKFLSLALIIFLTSIPLISFASSQEGEIVHSDPIAPVILGLIVILLAAKLGGEIFEKLNQPAVLGELIFGM
ncbi:MAG: hypothetical protein KAS01_03235, partial [Candidatus Pacebacteria bacterium]|nr:hypothetical protein [Candidatus Paceibacterota bacterium]